jgi:nitrite reductase/ring-hydroxylating ferredoxin subunit
LSAMARSSKGAVVVGHSSDVPERGRLVVEVDGVEVGVFRINGRLHAWENSCAHVGGPVCQGKVSNRVIERLDGEMRSLGDDYSATVHIVCPWHGYEYDIRTGEHPGDPDIRLKPYAVSESDGNIVVEL